MTTLLIKLNGAPEDEVEELRQLLAGHDIDFYETDAGRWGISVAAIWLRDETQVELARRLVDAYQEERSTRIRAEHDAQRQAGVRDTLSGRLKADPLRMAIYIFLVACVVCLTLMPFFGLI